jgi:hypothetical protein
MIDELWEGSCGKVWCKLVMSEVRDERDEATSEMVSARDLKMKEGALRVGRSRRPRSPTQPKRPKH